MNTHFQLKTLISCIKSSEITRCEIKPITIQIKPYPHNDILPLINSPMGFVLYRHGDVIITVTVVFKGVFAYPTDFEEILFITAYTEGNTVTKIKLKAIKKHRSISENTPN